MLLHSFRVMYIIDMVVQFSWLFEIETKQFNIIINIKKIKILGII